MDFLQMRRKLEQGDSIFELALTVVFYARVSTDQDAQLNSLSNQINYYEEYIKAKPHWTYGGGYIDEGISGISVEKRDDFLRMINDAKEGKFNLIITKEISRFSRNTLDSIKYTQMLLDYGVGVYFQTDNINTLYADAELRLTIMASIAQDEVRRLSERVRFGMKRAYEAGRVLGSKNIYGYDKENGKLTINEKEATFVRTLFTLYAEGQYGFRTIAQKLTAMGFVNQSGKALNPGTLSAVIENPKYKGYYCGRITERNNYRQKKNIKLPDEERIFYKDPAIPAIVSEALWDKANKILREKQARFKNKHPRTQNRYSYSGKILCQIHNAYYYRKVWQNKNEPVEHWCCKVYLAEGRKACSAPPIFTRELDTVLAFMGNGFIRDRMVVLQNLLARYTSVGILGERDYVKAIKKLSGEADKIMAKKDKLLELSLDSAIEKSEFMPMNARLSSQLEVINGEIEKLQAIQWQTQNKSDALTKINTYLEKRIDENIWPTAVAQNMLNYVLVTNKSTDAHLSMQFFMRYGETINVDLLRLQKPNSGKAVFIMYGDTEISPLVGSERQSEDLIAYISEEMKADPNKIWELNMFGKSMHDMVKDGLQNKLYRMPEDAQMKLQETLQKIINEGSGGLICIIL